MSTVQVAIHLPNDLWCAVQSLAPHEGDTATVILRASEEYITANHKHWGRRRSGKYQKLVQALTTPVVALDLSARVVTALRTLHIRYVYELVQRTLTDLFRLPNIGEKSLRDVKATLAILGLMLGMTLEDDAYRAAVVAKVAASITAARG